MSELINTKRAEYETALKHVQEKLTEFIERDGRLNVRDELMVEIAHAQDAYDLLCAYERGFIHDVMYLENSKIQSGSCDGGGAIVKCQ